MENKLLTVAETQKLIKQGQVLVIAGPDKLLLQLPFGDWIGGSNPYLQGKTGGIQNEDLLYVANFTSLVEDFKISIYDEDTIANITTEGYDNGVIITIMPIGSEVSREFAIKAPEFKNQFVNPLLGWLSGTLYEEFGQTKPSLYIGNKRVTMNLAVCLHLKLPKTKVARLEIINAYEAISDSDTLSFEEDGFDNEYCIVNGKKHNFYDYIAKKNINYPQLITNYSGAKINVGLIKEDKAKKMFFVAPVFKDTEYKFARKRTEDYKTFFFDKLKNVEDIKYSYSCLYNLFNFELGETQFGIPGVYTFGEIAYQLLNVTFVYLVIDEADIK